MLTPVKLLHIVNNYSDASNNRVVLELARGLAFNDNHFHVGCIENVGGALEEEFKQAGVNTINFGMRNYYAFDVLNRIREYILENEIDIVHTHILKADFLGGLAAKLRGQTTLIATKHNENFSPGQSGWFWRSPLYRLSLLLPDIVITVSEAMRDRLITEYNLCTDRVVTIHNGINIEYFNSLSRISENSESLRASWGLSADDFLVGFIGRLVRGKGLIDLLQAIRAVLPLHKRCFLLVVGTGPLLDQLTSKAKDLGIEKNVIFVGYRSDIPAILAAIDVFVLPSLSEGLPVSVIEAMAAEKAVIATPVGGVKELINSGETGIFVAPKDPGAITDAILDLINNEKRMQEIGLKAKVFIEEAFDARVMCKKYDALYHKLMQSKI